MTMGPDSVHEEHPTIQRNLEHKLLIVLKPFHAIGSDPTCYWDNTRGVRGGTVTGLPPVQGMEVSKIPLGEPTAFPWGPGYNKTKGARCPVRYSGVTPPHALLAAFLIQGDFQALQLPKVNGAGIETLERVS